MRYNFDSVTKLNELKWYGLLFSDAEYSAAPTLYHYTAEDNLNRIVLPDGISLRLTRADCFLDKNEGKHIISTFQYACEKAKADGNITTEFYDLLIQSIDLYSPMYDQLKQQYVFCFSKNGASQYLTQHYACAKGKKGVVIGLQALAIENLTATDGIQIYDVLYDKDQLATYMQQLIKRMYELADQDDSENTVIKQIVVSQLAAYGLVFKDSSFQNEEESRLVIDCSIANKENSGIFPAQDERYLYCKIDGKELYNLRYVP